MSKAHIPPAVAIRCCNTFREILKDFIILNLLVVEKSLTVICPYVSFRSDRMKIKNLKKEGKMRTSILICIYTIHFDYLKVLIKVEYIGSNRSREIGDRNFHWRERKMKK